MPRVPIPLTWKRRSFAVLEARGIVDRRTAVAVTGIIGGPFAIFTPPLSSCFRLIHLPSQSMILDFALQANAKEGAERFAALDVNWWSCLREEVIGPDLQEVRNVYLRLKGPSVIPYPLEREEE